MVSLKTLLSSKYGYVPAIIKACLAICLLLYLVYFNYRLLHITMEMTAILVSFCVLVITLNTFHLTNNRFYATIGIGYGFAAFLMLPHLLISIRSDIIPGLSLNSSQFGLLARVMQTGVVFYAVLAREKLGEVGRTIQFFFSITVLITIAVVYIHPLPILFSNNSFTGIAKLCYAFLAGICVINLLLISKEEFELPKDVRDNLIIVQVLNAIAFILFTLSVRQGDWAGAGTVVLSSISCYFFYCSMIKPVLTQPIENLYHSIMLKDEKLRGQEDEMAHLNRLNIAGQMAASIGHEIRNPMTTVRGYLQFLRKKQQFETYRDRFDIMIEELDRANEIISEYLSLANNRYVSRNPNRLERIAETLKPLLEANAVLEGKTVFFNLQETHEMNLDEREIRQMILNLARNGLEAVREGGVVEISTRMEDDKAILTVTDTGSGISQEAMDKIGSPFFTTKSNGTGLGLAVCYSIANKHSAKINAYNGSTGAVFEVIFFNEPIET